MLINVTCTLTALLALWSLLCLCRRPLPRQPGEILRFTQPRSLAILCLVLHGVMAFFTVASAWAGVAWVAAMFAAFQGLTAVLVTETCHRAFIITETGFTVRTFFGRVHEVALADVEFAFGHRDGMSCFVTAQRRYHLAFIQPVNAAISQVLQRGRRQAGLPEIAIRRASLDPFDGHVPDWPGMLAAYAIVTAMCLVMLGVCVAAVIRPIPMEKTEERVVAFRTWSDWRDDDLRFTGADGEAYVVSTGVENMAPVRDACGTGAAFTVLVRYVQPNRGDAYWRVYALHGADGTAYLPLEEAAAHERQTWGMVIVIWIVMSLVWAGYVLRSIQVGRHPERYSRRTIRRYFKDGYVR